MRAWVSPASRAESPVAAVGMNVCATPSLNCPGSWWGQRSCCNRRDGGRAQLLKEGHSINQSEPKETKVAERLDLDPQSAGKTTHPEVPRQFQGSAERPRRGWWPPSWKSHPFPRIVGLTLPLVYEITQPIESNLPNFGSTLALCHGPHSVCGACFSLNWNKSASYLSLFLSLNSFCDETSRT